MRARFWARITRLLLAHRYQSPGLSREDLDAAIAVAEHVTGARARRLIQIGGVLLLLKSGEYQAAFECLCDMPNASVQGRDDPDDYFLQCCMARCAAKLQLFDAQFNALYANLMLTERTGPAVRHAMAAAELAAALIPVGCAEQALELIEPQIRKAASRFDNPLLSAKMRVHAAIAKYVLGRAMDAHNDLLGIVHDGLCDLSRSLAFLVHSNMMDVCIHRGLYDEAHRAALQAYDAAGAMRCLAPLGVCHQGAGLIAYAQGDSERARELLEQSLTCYEQDLPINMPMNAHVDAGAVLAECYALQNQMELAYTSQRRYFEVYRRRLDAVNRGQLAVLKAQKNAAASISLSKRELECLSWSAAGKTAWETGVIMKLSEWTVVYHIEKAKRKFGLTRKQEVIAQAISLGLIKPNSHGDED